MIVEDHRVKNRRWESGFRLDLPEFSGERPPEEFLDWLSTTEEFLTYKGVSDEMCDLLVATCFQSRASAWWQQFKIQRANSREDRINSWENLKKHMQWTFLPYNYARTIYTKFQNLRQRGKTVYDYVAGFFSLLARNSLRKKKDQSVSRIIRRLRQQLHIDLLLFNPSIVLEAHQRAMLIEQSLRDWSASNVRLRTSCSVDISANTKKDQPTFTVGQEQSVATEGQRNIHTLTIEYFGCREMGHRQAACPQTCSLR